MEKPRDRSTRREQWPTVDVEAIGEHPARYLDRKLMTGAESGDAEPGEFVRARIRGIDRLDVIGAWIGVERRLDRGPRPVVIRLLQERAQELEEIGERPDRLPFGPRKQREPTGEDATWIGPDGEPYDPSKTAVAKVHRMRADGGADR